MKRLILLSFAFVLLSQSASAQEIVKQGLVENRRDSTQFRVAWNSLYDTSETFNTDGWEIAAIQFDFNPTSADSSQHYNIVPYWSNDQAAWANFGDSIQVVDRSTHFDQIIMRPLTYMMLIVRTNGEAIKNAELTTGTISICAKGGRGIW